MADLTVTRIESTDTAGLRQWHAVMREGCTAERTAAWWVSPEEMLTRFAHPNPARTDIAVLARLDGEPIGGAEIGLIPDSPAEVELTVLDRHRRAGHGRAIARFVADILSDSPARIVQTETYTPAGIAFAEAHGMRVGNVEDRLLLDLPAYLEADAERYRTRPAVRPLVGPADPTEIRPDPEWSIFSWIGMCPEEHLDSWARLREQMDEDVPLGDLTRTVNHADVAAIRSHEERMAERGWILVSSLAQLHVPQAQAVGYTEIMVSRHEGDIVIQEDTLVDRGHRGRGIGRALKVANLRQLHEVPEAGAAHWVQTYTASDNTAMLALNESLGFVFAETMTALEGPVSGLARP